VRASCSLFTSSEQDARTPQNLNYHFYYISILVQPFGGNHLSSQWFVFIIVEFVIVLTSSEQCVGFDIFSIEKLLSQIIGIFGHFLLLVLTIDYCTFRQWVLARQQGTGIYRFIN